MNATALLCATFALLCLRLPNAFAEETKPTLPAEEAAEIARYEKMLAYSLEKLKQVDKAKDPGGWMKLTDSYAAALEGLGRADEAVPLRRAVLKRAERLFASHQYHLVLHVLHLADVLAKTGCLEEAETNYQRVVAIMETEGAWNQAGLAMLLGRYAKFLETHRRFADAGLLSLRALEIVARANAVNPNNPRQFQEVIQNHTALLIKMGRTEPQAAEEIARILEPIQKR